MSKSLTDFSEQMRIYNANRPLIPAEQFERYADQWVAIRSDGASIVANNPDFETLVQRIVDAGYDPHADVMYEWVRNEAFMDVDGIEISDSIEPDRATSA